jgi:Uma2 family endonuclease
MKQITEKIYTYEDLIENKIPEYVFEVIEGIGVESMATSSYHNEWVSELFYYLRRIYGKSYKVLTNETSILVSKNPLTYVNADILLISKSKLSKTTEHILEIPPDIVFEIVVSYEPNVEYKMNAYQKIGVLKQFWVYPKERRVIVIDRDGNKTEYPFNKKIEVIEGKKILLSRFKI